MQQEEQHTSEKRIYFTVIVDKRAGLADQLTQFMILRKLGLYLRYSYLHTPLDSYRNNILTTPSNLRLLRILEKVYRKIFNYYQKYAARSIYHTNIYEFIGLNPHFTSSNQNVEQQNDIEKWNVLNFNLLSLSDTEKTGISTFEELENHIKDRISERNNSSNPILVKLYMGEYRTYLWRTIKKTIPDSIDALPLEEIYFQHRHKQPWKMKFPVGRLKTLVHIRMGDFASIKTPWETWIYYGRRGWQESQDENEFTQLTIADFYNFTQHLISYFNDGTFAIHFSSDGFTRFFKRLSSVFGSNSSNLASSFPKITEQQLRTLIKSSKYYERKFEILKSIKNSISVIGETTHKLFDFIHSAMTADLIITANPADHSMLLHLWRYCHRSKTLPIIILLYKPIMRETILNPSYFLLQDHPLYKKKRIILVDITEPNFDQLSQQLNELFPNLSN